MNRLFSATLLAATLVLALGWSSSPSQAGTMTYVTDFPKTDNIQSDLINTFPNGIFTASNSYGTSFDITSASCTAGPFTPLATPCNYYDGFGFNGSDKALTIPVGVAGVTNAFTLMNAYWAFSYTGLIATVEFQGSGGAMETFDLFGGTNIRDYLETNPGTTGTINGTTTQNAFNCVDPGGCFGSGGSGNVETGLPGTYGIDEQGFALDSAFASQTLTDIVITDEFESTAPILLGVTVESNSTAVPEPSSLPLLLAGLGLIGGAVYFGRKKATARI